MINRLLLAAASLTVTAALGMLATRTAKSHNIDLAMLSPAGAAILICGSLAQVVCIAFSHGGVSGPVLTAALPGIVVSAATDALSGYVFDAIALPSLAMALLLAQCDHHFVPAAFGALASGLALAVLFALSSGKGLGFGDVKLACCIGAGLGARGALAALGMAFVAGGIYAAYLLLSRRAKLGSELFFAPYLAGGTLCVALMGVSG